MVKKPSPARSGELTGALIGAVSRPAVVSAFWLIGERHGDSPWITWLVVLFASCTIGFFLGGFTGKVAGSFRHAVIGPTIGAMLGAILALGSSVLTLVCVCGLTETRNPPNVVVYWATMALAGALPGVGGGLAGNRLRQEQTTESPEDQHTEGEPPNITRPAARSGMLTGAILGAVCPPALILAFYLIDARGSPRRTTREVQGDMLEFGLLGIGLLVTSCILGLISGGFAGRIADSIRHKQSIGPAGANQPGEQR